MTVILFCTIGGQHDGHLPFWSPGFVTHFVVITCFVCFAEINILPLLLLLLGCLRDFLNFTFYSLTDFILVSCDRLS